ncbi:TLR adapter interacting with SLC15A4 on the lysosome [Conger conger]|uniref:TLR adapter interacting with SLC15A4 on the lysosome n=1 Tax=Conger conger TaxID=82655 RepID=UPI002A5AD256|nr:TLR adapter interacting with SLC15A4 on the lysosome [Conger conger]
MLCESVLWRMRFCQDREPQRAAHSEPGPRRETRVSPGTAEPVSFPQYSSRARSGTEATSRDGRGVAPSTSQNRTSPEVDIPGLSKPSGDTFLVPSSCKSICKNYSDLLIGGDQVLPLSESAGQGQACGSPQLPSGPFLQSSEIPPPMESLPQGSPPSARNPRRGDSSRWRTGSGKDRSFLFQGSQPLSNAQLNAYLEQKLLDLYRQYMLESLAQRGSPSAVLASELILTSVDHLTQQLSREQNLEAAAAKDMVISCLLRVASGLPTSGEISTPQLQISDDQP